MSVDVMHSMITRPLSSLLPKFTVNIVKHTTGAHLMHAAYSPQGEVATFCVRAL